MLCIEHLFFPSVNNSYDFPLGKIKRIIFNPNFKEEKRVPVVQIISGKEIQFLHFLIGLYNDIFVNLLADNGPNVKVD